MPQILARNVTAPNPRSGRTATWKRVRIGMLVGIAVFGGAAAIAVWSGFTNDSRKQIFRVSGFSMAPTLYGDYQFLSCPQCSTQTKVATELASVLAASARTAECWHCGAKFKCDSDAIDSHVIEGDLVQVTAIGPNASNRIRIGDIVAVKMDGLMRVKRILGLPGDVVSVDERRLLVNGKRLEIMLAESNGVNDAAFIDVDIDQQRSDSRWADATEGGDSDWLVYHHRSVYEHSRPSEICDDYPCNVDVIRRLDPVDQLAVTLSVAAAATIDVAFYSDQGTRIATRHHAANEPLTITVGQAELAETITLTPRTPIAIRVREEQAQDEQGDRVQLNDLRVRRSVEYRLRRRDSDAVYPLKLNQGECFIVGDNVPISVDSRDFGPLPMDNIVGFARRLTWE
ncbi:S26 family signal peptidase [Novipirellula sp. SH528]|uniref:S26 family signal peptidase n=1 Tax=Novipirellula sp. SH528 TaxID=3454466 RepID=UPI003F9FAF13